MSAINTKSTKSEILAAYEQLQAQVAQLERNQADDQRRIGVMMYEANQLQHRINELESEVEDLSSQLSDINEDELNDTIESQRDIIKIQAARIKLLSHKVAAQPKTAPPASPKKPAPKPSVPVQVEAQPAIRITDTDRRVWAAFNALPREKRQAYYEFAHSNGYGHLGLHNIAVVREAYLAKQAA